MQKSYAEVLFEWGMEKGLQQGAIQSKQEAILQVLEARFGQLPEGLAAKVQSIADLQVLDDLVVQAAKCTSLAEF